MDDEILFEVRGLKKYYPIRGGLLQKKLGAVRAIDGIDFFLKKGETLGLVGESGCGKTTTGRCLLMLTPPTGGHIYYKLPTDVRKRLLELEKLILDEKEVTKEKESDQKELIAEYEAINDRYALDKMSDEGIRQMRKTMQIVFQDPYSSLNPRMLIKDIIGEPLLVHGVSKGSENLESVKILLEKVGLNQEHLYRYPHEFSGGQRQRIGVARALSLNPDLVVLDEPTSALDVSVQAQILNLLNDLQKEFGLTYLFISHDLSSIRYMCDRVNVMYLGKIVESAKKADLFNKPLHPYTEALLSVIPVPDPEVKRMKNVLTGDVPSPANPPSGCRFHTRCRYREAICEELEPELKDKGGEHFVSCHFR
jgi:oligopeptide/dipeptide ABC transporter ATP-binding protein